MQMFSQPNQQCNLLKTNQATHRETEKIIYVLSIRSLNIIIPMLLESSLSATDKKPFPSVITFKKYCPLALEPPTVGHQISATVCRNSLLFHALLDNNKS